MEYTQKNFWKQYFFRMFTRKSIFEAPIDVIGVKYSKTCFLACFKTVLYGNVLKHSPFWYLADHDTPKLGYHGAKNTYKKHPDFK